MKLFNRNRIEHPAPRHALDFRWMRWAHDRVNSFLKIQVITGNTSKPYVQVAQGNLTIVLPEIGAGGATSAFAITELGHQDYFVARQLSNVRLDDDTGLPIADVGATDIKIAKVLNVRRSIISQFLYGDNVTYTDDDGADIDNTRNADNGVDAIEAQDCLPPYITMTTLGLASPISVTAQCVVYAKKVTGFTGVFDGETQLEWLEDAGHHGVRAFAQRNS